MIIMNTVVCITTTSAATTGGAGGKGTWGIPGSELIGVEETVEDDPHDPNYDSDSQDNCKFEAITPPLNEDEIEKFVSPIIAEYFDHGDTEEVIYALEDLNLDDNEYQVLVIAVSMAMEKKSSHREMTSVLISDFYGRVFSEPDIEKGFDILLKSLPELILDTPGAATILGNFIARAVADDCIPPAFVNRYLEAPVSDEKDSHIKTAVEHASALLNMKHGLVRLDSVWGVTGGMRPVKYLIRQMQLLLKEYISSGELEEALRCLQELEVPHFHHEMVYEAILMAVEDMGDKTQDLISALLKSLCSSVIVSVDQLKNGFNRIYVELDDIVLDTPLAYQNLERFVSKCVDFIPRELVLKCPSRYVFVLCSSSPSTCFDATEGYKQEVIRGRKRGRCCFDHSSRMKDEMDGDARPGKEEQKTCFTLVIFVLVYVFLTDSNPLSLLFVHNRGRKRFVSEGDGGKIKDE